MKRLKRASRKETVSILMASAVLLGVGGIALKYYHSMEETVSASGSPIVIDAGSPQAITIPEDGTKLWETGLSVKYNDFVQTKDKVANLVLENAKAQQYQINYSFSRNQIELSDGKRIALWTQRNDGGISNKVDPEPNLIKSGIALLDIDGSVIKEIEFESEARVDHNSTTALPYTTGVGSQLIKNSDGSFSTFYGLAPAGKPAEIRKITFTAELKIIDKTKVAYELGTEEFSVLFSQYKDKGKDKYYQLGYLNTGSKSSSTNNFPLYEYDMVTNTTSKLVTLKLPPFATLASCPNPDSYPETVKQVTDIVKLNDSAGGGYIAQLVYSSWNGSMPVAETGIAIAKFDSAGNYVTCWQSDNKSRTISILNEISSASKIYMEAYDSTETRILSLTEGTTLKEEVGSGRFPADTSLTVLKNEDITYGTYYEFYGTIQTNAGDFTRLPSSGVVIGSMYKDFQISNVQMLSQGQASFSSYLPSQINSSKILFVGGSSDFSFSEIPGIRDSSNSAPLGPGWVNYWKTSTTYGVAGNFRKEDDFTPLISKSKGIVVDITDTDIQSPTATSLNNWNTLDRWLITGEKNGSLSSTASIKVYDTVTSNESTYGQGWLEKRINRNYSSSSNPIDWAALGFDKKNSGPQLVTYFVSDSQNQVSTTSRWINKRTAESVIKSDYALDAQNFAVALTDVATDIPDENSFKTLAKTNAWYMATSSLGATPKVDEDSVAGNFNPAKVSVDSAQLAALQNATEAKPYPVDVSYDTDGDGKFDGSGDITNRVWVFVTTKNTVVDKEADSVIYADDYEIPFRLAASETDMKFYENANVKVYQYKDITHETSAVLPTIADKDKPAGLSSGTNPTISNASAPGKVKPTVSYHNATLNKTATTSAAVTLTSNVLIHLKQVIFSSTTDDLDQIPIPKTGYITLDNDGTQRKSQVPSGKEGDSISYETFYAEFDYTGSKKIVFTPTIPEFYELKGYVVTNTNTPHKSTQIVTSAPKVYTYDFTGGDNEVYVTVYLSPKLSSENQPELYHWDDQENDLGSITVD